MSNKKLDLSVKCESCGNKAEVKLSDNSLWCLSCHSTALKFKYDKEFGEFIEDEKTGQVGGNESFNLSDTVAVGGANAVAETG